MLADGQTKVMAPSAALATAPPREEPNVSRDRPLVEETRRDELTEMMSFKGGDKAADGSSPKADAPAAAPSAITAQSLKAEAPPATPAPAAQPPVLAQAPETASPAPAHAASERAPGPREQTKAVDVARALAPLPDTPPPSALIETARAADAAQAPAPKAVDVARPPASHPATPPSSAPTPSAVAPRRRRNPASARPRRSKRDWPIWRRRSRTVRTKRVRGSKRRKPKRIRSKRSPNSARS